MKLYSKQELIYAVNGTAFFASGGGGSRSIGLNIIEAIMKESSGEPVPLWSPDDIDPGSTGAVLAYMGAPSAMKKASEFNSPRRSLDTLAGADGGKDYSFCVPVEVGPVNSFIPLLVSSQKKLAAVDSDGAGRAVPKLGLTTFAQGGVSVNPSALANEGAPHPDVASLLFVDEPGIVEDLARPLISTPEYGQITGLASFTMTRSQLSQLGLAGNIERSRQVGEAMEKSSNPVKTLLGTLNPSWLLAEGTITDITVKEKGGFDLGTVTVESDSGSQATIYFQNESLLMEVEGRPVAMGPDCICCLSPEYKYGLSNDDIKKGMKVAYIGLKCAGQMRAKRVVAEFLSLIRMFGYKGEYIPIEKLNRET